MGEAIVGTSETQIKHLLVREGWATEWHDHDLFATEQPQHNLEVPSFGLAVHPVTNGEYRQFVWATGHRIPRHWLNFDVPAGLDDHPVVNVSLADAQAYCRWLSQLTQQPYRLPTEFEWERAARGDDERTYPWGSEFEVWRCNTQESSRNQTSPVGMYSPSGDSPFGLSDLSGNVYEWTSSEFGLYQIEDDEDETAPAAGEAASGKRTVRGGSFYYSHRFARCAARESALPTYMSPSLGFRVALDVTG
jgi:formylglycine-generating enzyme required for sulfatase activity